MSLIETAKNLSMDYIKIRKFPNPISYDITKLNHDQFCYYFRTPEEYQKWLKIKKTVRGIFPKPWFDDKNCTPWIENWINNRSTEKLNMFEWGAGGTTIHFSKYINTLVTCEDNIDWINRVSSYVLTFHPENLSKIGFIYQTDINKYISSITNFDDNSFDIVSVDGLHNTRDACFKVINNKLKINGLCILDNVDQNFNSKTITNDYIILKKFGSTWCLEKHK